MQRSYDSGSGSGIALPYLCAQPKLSAAEVTSSTNATALVPNPWITQVATDHFCGHSSSRSANSTRPNNADNHYWCTVCEDLKSFKDSGGWKKHEKEHETIFICGLGDTAENSTASQSHASNPYTCKRRDMMVNHLSKLHGISEAHHGRDLADQLQHTVEKQAWSCGFCIHLLLTFQDRLKHIDIEHFRRHQSILEWDWNKVILGLLQQPKMEKAWKMRTASLPPWVHLETLSWDKATAKELRATLEIGPSDEHHANTLANAAYSARIRNERSWPQSGTINAHRHSDATAHANFLASSNHYEATSALKCDSGLYPGLSPSITGSNTHLVSSDSSCFEAPKSSFSFGNTVEVAMPSLDDDGGVDHNALPFNPSQSWSSASQPGIFNGYELSGSYGGRSADCLTPNQYGQ